MKKLFTIILLALVLVIPANARKLISFGPKVGMNFNFASGSDMLKPGNIGYTVGAFLEVRPVKFVSVSADVMYSKEGYKLGVDYQGMQSTLDYSFGYINIPILANFYIWKGLNVKAGVMPSIKLSGKVSFEGIDVSDNDNVKGVKKGAFAIPVGVGYSFGIGLDIDLRYNIGLSNTANIGDMDFSSKVLQLTVGWKF